jgi:ATP-dependent DNA helicase RecG
MNQTSPEQLDRLINRIEDCHLEFKAAQHSFNQSHDLPDYCAALANERGGKLLLGVKEKADKRGEAIGTSAFSGTHNKLSNELLDKLGIRIDVEEVFHTGKRVLIFHVPSRPTGGFIRSTGHYEIPMRAGESLREMDDLTIKTILSENAPDFSMTIVPGLSLDDLDIKAMGIFKAMWAQKAKRDDYRTFSEDKMLLSVGVLSEKGLNFAGLVLFGKKEKIDELLPDAEIIFEWRQNAASTPHDYRVAWRDPFFSVYDSIWETINARNSRMPFQQGFIQREIFAFDEKPIREAVLNAVSHRDYTIKGQSIFIKASPEEFRISSPGSFPLGITIENVLYKSYWRNRRIAEVFEKAGLVERSGQGMDDIFQATIRDGKGRPDLSQSDEYSVVLSIPARLKDKDFVLFLEKIINEKQINFSFEEMLELETIRQNGIVSKPEFARIFLDIGIIEKLGKTSDTRYILSHQYYSHIGRKGTHTRIAGLNREKHKQLIIDHITKNQKGFVHEFKEAFPELSTSTINNILSDLRRNEKIEFIGARKTGYWVIKQ